MIKFPCKCGHLFSVPEDMAGALVQCPRCGLAADVPTLGDLVNITDDGIFKIDEAPEAEDGISVARLQEVFNPRTLDAEGRQKDLRHDEEHYHKVGVPREVDGVGYSPKYDPDTGELIRPLELRDEGAPVAVVPLAAEEAADEPLAVIPVSTAPLHAAPAVAYASNQSRHVQSLGGVLLELFMPGNVVVMLFIFGLSYVAEKAAGILTIGQAVFPLMPLLNLPLWLLLAHYGCVIEDLGPNDCDELPRPLRHFASMDDLFMPFFVVALALVICYFPAMVAGMEEKVLRNRTVGVMLILELVGSIFLPAVLLTTVTGASLANLRPDRVLKVIYICGGDYLLSVGIFLLAMFPSSLYLAASAIMPKDLQEFIAPKLAANYVMLPLTALSVYLMHFFCWHLGILYREHNGEFPWVLQRHDSNRRDPVYAPPRSSRKKSSL